MKKFTAIYDLSFKSMEDQGKYRLLTGTFTHMEGTSNEEIKKTLSALLEKAFVSASCRYVEEMHYVE